MTVQSVGILFKVSHYSYCWEILSRNLIYSINSSEELNYYGEWFEDFKQICLEPENKAPSSVYCQSQPKSCTFQAK